MALGAKIIDDDFNEDMCKERCKQAESWDARISEVMASSAGLLK